MIRTLATGLIVLAVLTLVAAGLGVMGAFMTEQDSVGDLLGYAAIVGAALLLLWGGVRLRRRT